MLTNSPHSRIKAVLETLVVFILTLLVIGVFANSSVGHWEKRILKRGFIEYALMIAILLIILVVTRRNLRDYGVTFRNMKYHLNTAFTCFIPFAAVRALLFLTDFDYKPLCCLRRIFTAESAERKDNSDTDSTFVPISPDKGVGRTTVDR